MRISVLIITFVTYAMTKSCPWTIDLTAPCILMVCGVMSVSWSCLHFTANTQIANEALGQHVVELYFMVMFYCSTDYTRSLIMRVSYLIVMRPLLMRNALQIPIMLVLAAMAEYCNYLNCR